MRGVKHSLWENISDTEAGMGKKVNTLAIYCMSNNNVPSRRSALNANSEIVEFGLS